MSKFAEYRSQTKFELPETMQAAVVSGAGFENLACREVPIPQVGPNQLLARVDAAGVCTSILKLIAQGDKHTFINGWDLEKFPIILGDEGSVTVVKVGENITDQYKQGQRFGVQPAVDVAPINHRERYKNNAEGMFKCAVGYTLGGNLAQYILIPEEVLEGQCLMPLPSDEMSYFGVSMAEPISCICSAQERNYHIHKAGPHASRQPKLGLLEGGTTVIVGAGGMGLMHLEMAMRYRPKTIIVSDLVEEKLEKALSLVGEKAKGLGIDLITTLPDKIEATLKKASQGKGADDIILAVGVQPVQQHALTMLGKGGVANLFGGLPKGKNMLQIDAIAVHYDEIKLVGSSGGEPSDLKVALDAIASGDIDAGNYVYAIGSLKHVPQALQMIAENKTDGKIIIYPHAEIDELMPVTYWDAQKEKDYLNERLS